jgi:hypothetical protein
MELYYFQNVDAGRLGGHVDGGRGDFLLGHVRLGGPAGAFGRPDIPLRITGVQDAAGDIELAAL